MFGVSTNVIVTADLTQVFYHNTCVVSFDKTSITLDTNGWYTPTTKRRMCQAAEFFNLNFTVYQEDWDWFIVRKVNGEWDWDNPIPFHDGIVLER